MPPSSPGDGPPAGDQAMPEAGGPGAFTPRPHTPGPPGSGPPGPPGSGPPGGPGPVPGSPAPGSPAPGSPAPGSPAPGPGLWRSAAVSVAVVAGTAVLGVAAGFIWAAVAPRAALVMVGPGEAAAVHAETSAFIAADAWFSLIMVVGGLISGVAGYVLAVRRHGPLAMVGVLAGAVAAAFLARLAGELPGRGTLNHLLATLPAGAHLLDVLSLGATGALAFWPLVAGLVAGVLVSFGPDRPGGSPRRDTGGAGGPGGGPGAPGPA